MHKSVIMSQFPWCNQAKKKCMLRLLSEVTMDEKRSVSVRDGLKNSLLLQVNQLSCIPSEITRKP